MQEKSAVSDFQKKGETQLASGVVPNPKQVKRKERSRQITYSPNHK